MTVSSEVLEHLDAIDRCLDRLSAETTGGLEAVNLALIKANLAEVRRLLEKASAPANEDVA